jgi:hypothetical protein
MAQTIVAQRGTTTNASDGVTKTTLFTQSTGIATRVIINSVSFVNPDGTSSGVRMSLMINVNGSGSFTPVALVGTNTTAGRALYGLSMMPGSAGGEIASTGTGATPFPSRWVTAVASTASYLGNELANAKFEFSGPQGNAMSNTDSPVYIVPNQFWMNSGDVLSIVTWNTNNRSANVVYSFTTITES